MSGALYGPQSVPQVGNALPGLPVRGRAVPPPPPIPVPYADTAEWVRPADWLTLPTLVDGDQKFVGLLGIASDANYIAVRAAGNYTVDWGEGGATENANANVTSYHLYTPGSISAGTLTSKGFKQVIVTITPQGGQNLTLVNLALRHNQLGLSVSTDIPWLDIAVNSPNLTSFIPSDSSNMLRSLEQCYIRQNALTSGAYMFYQNNALRSVIFASTSTFTSTANLFDSCTALANAPVMDLSSVTNTSSMFIGCRALRNIPSYSLLVCTNATSMFANCISMLKTPTLGWGLPGSLDCTSIFLGCLNLLEISSPFVLASATTATSAFASCYSLKKAGRLYFPRATGLSSLFSTCYALSGPVELVAPVCTTLSSAFTACGFIDAQITLVLPASGVSMSLLFANCVRMQSINVFNSRPCSDATQMFDGCTALRAIPRLDLSQAGAFVAFARNCLTLASVPDLDLTACTSLNSAFNGDVALRYGPAFKTTASLTSTASMYSGCSGLQKAELFNTTGVTSTAQMFQSCTSLVEVGAYDLSACTTLDSMFSTCTSLLWGPDLTLKTTAGTVSANSMFGSCSSLLGIPAYNTAGLSVITAMFSSCASLKELPALNLANVTTGNAASSFLNCQQLMRSQVTGLKYSHSYANARLSAAALDEIYTNLGSATAQTITQTGCVGLTGDTPSIATGKGWTVAA